jgi:hypothetical protein
MEEIEFARGEAAGGHAVERVFLGAVVVFAFEKGEQPHGIPPETFDQGLRNLALPIVVGEGAPEKSFRGTRLSKASKQSLSSPLPPMRAEME